MTTGHMLARAARQHDCGEGASRCGEASAGTYDSGSKMCAGLVVGRCPLSCVW
jgi:hypothetical protein